MAYDKVKYNTEYNKAKYSELRFRVPKGQKEIIDNYWKAMGYSSFSAYMNELIARDMAKARAGDKTVNIGHDNIGTINM